MIARAKSLMKRVSPLLKRTLKPKGYSLLAKGLLMSLALLFMGLVHGQKRLNDPSIVSQHKRMVYEAWGDFRPYPKYLLGVQTNLAYATVWGMWAPKRNQDYRSGPDLRPLAVGGKETQRLLALEFQLNQTQQVQGRVDSLQSQSLLDLAYHTNLSPETDPLWLLYYKGVLAAIDSYKDEPTRFEDWNLSSQKSFEALRQSGGLGVLKEQLQLLKSRFELSKSAVMPRGKRLLLYHSCLVDLRKFELALKQRDARAQAQTLAFERMKSLKAASLEATFTYLKSDKALVQGILTTYKAHF